MLWLKSKGHKVLGVELSLKAIESFSEENNLKFNQSEQNNFQVFDSKNLSIFQGDIFKLSEKNLEKVEAVFDRGCYIALSEKNRKKLAEIYCNKLAKGSKILLLNLEYGGASAEPPPHSISESELEENFAKHFQISKHLDEDVLEAKEHYKDAGMEWARDKVHILIKK